MSRSEDASKRRHSAGDRHDGFSAWLCAAPRASRAVESAGFVVAAAVDTATAAPDRLSADPTAVRYSAARRGAAAPAVVADAAALDARHCRDHRGGRAAVESAGCYDDRKGAAGPPHR